MTQIRAINPAQTGRYQVTTATGSRYEIVLNGADKTVVRWPQSAEGKLRRDEQPIKILELVRVQVGQSAQLLLAPLGSGDVTTRITSQVEEINWVPLSD
ncbi:hypothetical protein [Levilactobacillus huananensis]|uniref:hypothetical protein n=1 Tax=Levilactobacillus huananensis TaxID=2486019 RepID=UPI000F7AC9E6|nr:hypothetical protein [Levilactobacillus huananensis]